MKRSAKPWISFFLLIVMVFPLNAASATLRARTLAGWENYVSATERRIGREMENASEFLILDSLPEKTREQVQRSLDRGEVYVAKRQTRNDAGKEIHVDSGMIHHWYGAVFVPNTNLRDVLRWVQNYEHHAEYFRDVERSRLISRNGNDFRIFLRLTRKKVVTVHYNTEHSVTYTDRGYGGYRRISSRSIADRIAELENAGSTGESEKTPDDDSGFLWRLNSYWRYEERNGGVVIECESISLSRSIPFALGWLIRPFVESVPRESLTGMLESIRDGIENQPAQ